MAESIGKGTFELDADTSKAKAELTGFEHWLSEFRRRSAGILWRVGLFGGLTAGLLAFSGALRGTVAASAQFEQTMANVAAVARATSGDVQRLDDAARALGRTANKFSANEAAEGMLFLAMAGNTVNTIIGAMPDVLNLAAAGNVELGRAADIVTNILAGYNIEVGKLTQASDALVNTFTSSNVTLEHLAHTMSFVAPVASSQAIALEETAAAAGLLGNAGIQGARAGTALRGAITRLLNPTFRTKKIIEELGLELVDSNGKFKGYINLLEELERTGASTADIMRMFGVFVGPSLLALLSQGSNALTEFTDKNMRSAGITAEIAAVQVDTFSGTMKTLGSNIQDVGIDLGNLVKEEIRDFMQWLIDSGIPALRRMGDTLKRTAEGIKAFNKHTHILSLLLTGTAAALAVLTLQKLVALATLLVSRVILAGIATLSNRFGMFMLNLSTGLVTINAFLVAFVALAVTAEALSRFITGKSLLTHMLGSGEAAERQAEAISAINAELRELQKIGSDATRLDIIEQHIIQNLGDYERAAKAAREEREALMESQPHFVQEDTELFTSAARELELVTDVYREYFKELVEAGATFEDLWVILERLPPALKEELYLVAELDKVWKAYADTRREAETLAEREAHEKQLEVMAELHKEFKKSIRSMLPSIKETFDEWQQRLGDMLIAYENFTRNIQLLRELFTLAGLGHEVTETLIKEIEESSPLLAQVIVQRFAKDPAAAIDTLAPTVAAAETSLLEQVEDVIKDKETDFKNAAKNHIVDPVLDEIIQANQTAYDAGVGFAEEILYGIVEAFDEADDLATQAMLGLFGAGDWEQWLADQNFAQRFANVVTGGSTIDLNDSVGMSATAKRLLEEQAGRLEGVLGTQGAVAFKRIRDELVQIGNAGEKLLDEGHEWADAWINERVTKAFETQKTGISDAARALLAEYAPAIERIRKDEGPIAAQEFIQGLISIGDQSVRIAEISGQDFADSWVTASVNRLLSGSTEISATAAQLLATHKSTIDDMFRNEDLGGPEAALALWQTLISLGNEYEDLIQKIGPANARLWLDTSVANALVNTELKKSIDNILKLRKAVDEARDGITAAAESMQDAFKDLFDNAPDDFTHIFENLQDEILAATKRESEALTEALAHFGVTLTEVEEAITETSAEVKRLNNDYKEQKKILDDMEDELETATELLNDQKTAVKNLQIELRAAQKLYRDFEKSQLKGTRALRLQRIELEKTIRTQNAILRELEVIGRERAFTADEVERLSAAQLKLAEVKPQVEAIKDEQEQLEDLRKELILVADESEELTPDEMIRGLKESQSEVERLTGELKSAELAMNNQQKAVNNLENNLKDQRVAVQELRTEWDKAKSTLNEYESFFDSFSETIVEKYEAMIEAANKYAKAQNELAKAEGAAPVATQEANRQTTQEPVEVSSRLIRRQDRDLTAEERAWNEALLAGRSDDAARAEFYQARGQRLAGMGVPEIVLNTFREELNKLGVTPSFHMGGIVGGMTSREQMIRVREGEGVFTPEQMAALGDRPLVGSQTFIGTPASEVDKVLRHVRRIERLELGR